MAMTHEGLRFFGKADEVKSILENAIFASRVEHEDGTITPLAVDYDLLIDEIENVARDGMNDHIDFLWSRLRYGPEEGV
jgi:hypothetical protein